MKRLLTAIIVKDLSLFGIVLGSANSWGWLITISGIGFVAGLILLAISQRLQSQVMKVWRSQLDINQKQKRHWVQQFVL